MAEKPAVGVAVIVIRGQTVLLGQRLSPLGAGTWQFPGGHLEHMETVAQCAEREVWEETGLHIHTIRYGPYTNDIFVAENRHYVTLFVTALAAPGDPIVREPTKCAGWGWFTWSALPEPLFLPIANLRQQGYLPPLADTQDTGHR